MPGSNAASGSSASSPRSNRLIFLSVCASWRNLGVGVEPAHFLIRLRQLEEPGGSEWHFLVRLLLQQPLVRTGSPSPTYGAPTSSTARPCFRRRGRRRTRISASRVRLNWTPHPAAISCPCTFPNFAPLFSSAPGAVAETTTSS